ncbi:trafficking protein particle complex subunit 12-like [Actinia tenebrosa]|uniref:Trafficking protein particle complex subunit 12-like n=1 Tax=Actinia tenebrosa TaxID=6105 RepID=A0A6P8HJM8_ACTTE|nr:trafficking protein particle complex subunit 12-like [Actinia tenebrosa]
MGQGKSKEGYQKAVKKLSSLELDNIEAVFNELSIKTEDGKRRVELSLLTRQEFAERFHLTGFVAERLCHAFDKTETGTIELDEFIGGIALCLHGSVRDKCRLLFKIFDLDQDDGVSKDELTAVLLSSVESAEKILNNIEGQDTNSESDETDKLIDTVTKIVQKAFETCDTAKSGKLSAKQFSNWLIRNPKIMDNVFGWQCPRPEEGHWMNENLAIPAVRIGMAESASPRMPSPFSQMMEAEAKESRKLSDLFNDPHSSTADEGQSFFDTLNHPSNTPGDSIFVQTNTEEATDSQKEDDGQTAVETQVAFQGLPINNEPQESIHFKGLDSFQDQPLVPDPSESPDIPSEPPHKSLEDIVEAERRSEPGFIGEDSLQQPFQFVQQPFPIPMITQHHLQDASTPQQPFQPSSIPVTPTCLQNMKVYQDPATKHPLEDTSQHHVHETTVHPPIPTVPEVEVHSKQTKEDLLASAWIPSPQTSDFLTAITSGMINKTDIDQQFLTSPGIVIDNSQLDPVKDLLLKFMDEHDVEKRQTLGVDNVPLNESGLRDLLSAECWRAALDFTSRFLTAHGQGVGQYGQRAMHTHKTLQVWFCRIALLYKLQMYSTAEAELEAFKNFDQPDLYYEFYPETYPGRKGCMVPFSLRILLAELPQHSGKPNEALDRLYSLQRTCKAVLKNLANGLDEDGSKSADKSDDMREAAVKMWNERELRVLYAIGNCFLAVKDYNLAVSVFESIIKQDETLSAALYSGIGRIYLQLGDLERAENYFKIVEERATGDPENMSTVVMNKGFMALARGSHEDAHKHFVAATKLDPENSVATNNVAVCLLFLGKLKEALQVLESIIWSNPPKNLNDGLLFNLCTIYELESSWSLQKKQKLLELVSQYKGDGFNVSCLKIS